MSPCLQYLNILNHNPCMERCILSPDYCQYTAQLMWLFILILSYCIAIVKCGARHNINKIYHYYYYDYYSSHVIDRGVCCCRCWRVIGALSTNGLAAAGVWAGPDLGAWPGRRPGGSCWSAAGSRCCRPRTCSWGRCHHGDHPDGSLNNNNNDHNNKDNNNNDNNNKKKNDNKNNDNKNNHNDNNNNDNNNHNDNYHKRAPKQYIST